MAVVPELSAIKIMENAHVRMDMQELIVQSLRQISKLYNRKPQH